MTINNTLFLESVRERFEEAVSVGDFEMARAAIKDCRENNFSKEADVLEAELKQALHLAEEDC